MILLPVVKYIYIRINIYNIVNITNSNKYIFKDIFESISIEKMKEKMIFLCRIKRIPLKLNFITVQS